jgi:hypothetical protein
MKNSIDWWKCSIVELGEIICDIGTIIIQGIREDNGAKRGGVVIGLAKITQHLQEQNTLFLEEQQQKWKSDYTPPIQIIPPEAP